MLKVEDFAIRPLELKDKDCVMKWRNTERIRANMYSDHIISQAEHDAWFNRALVDSSAAYFIFLHEGRSIGFIAFTNINQIHGRCSWAFYLGETDVPRGSGAAMEFFALDFAFTALKIRKLCCEVFVFNTAVIRLHEKFGFFHEGKLVKQYKKNDKYEDIACLAKFGAEWIEEKERFSELCFRTN